MSIIEMSLFLGALAEISNYLSSKLWPERDTLGTSWTFVPYFDCIPGGLSHKGPFFRSLCCRWKKGGADQYLYGDLGSVDTRIFCIFSVFTVW